MTKTMPEIRFCRPSGYTHSVETIRLVDLDLISEMRLWGNENLSDTDTWNKCLDYTLVSLGRVLSLYDFRNKGVYGKLVVFLSSESDAVKFKLAWGGEC